MRLFHRTTRSQTLTDDGLAYLDHCRQALDELRTGQALLESGRREVGGRLKVAMPVLFGRYCVAPLLLELAQRHPKLELDLRFNDSLVDIQAERFDLAIRNGAPGELTRKLADQRKVVCAAPAYIATRGGPDGPGRARRARSAGLLAERPAVCVDLHRRGWTRGHATAEGALPLRQPGGHR